MPMTETDWMDLWDCCTAAIHNLERALAGETVEGLRLGDPGITREWCEAQLANHREMLERVEKNLARFARVQLLHDEIAAGTYDDRDAARTCVVADRLMAVLEGGQS
jgi:hypothetical protein